MSLSDTKSLEDEFKPERFPRSYSKQELEDFGASLEKFRVKGKFTNPNTGEVHDISFIDVKEAMVDAGAMRKRSLPYVSYSVVVVQDGEDRHGKARIKWPTAYDIFMDKYEQFTGLTAKRDYAKAQELKEYAKMAEQNMETDSFPIIDESYGDGADN